MNIGIIIGLMTVVLALILNYLILFKFEDYGKKVKHFTITYYWTWLISLVPFVGFIWMIVWFICYCAAGFKCTSKLFEKK